jgi:thiamine kinase-like enzyme
VRGNSGADLQFAGDYVLKSCPNAVQQVEWFGCAQSVGLVDGVRLPYVELVNANSYKIEYIRGYSATQITSVQDFARLVKLVGQWEKQPAASSGDWDGYLQRLEDHVRVSNSEEMMAAFELACRHELPGSFNHGDLTLENVLVENDGGMVLIDPNFESGLFQSYLLDYGKLLQSVHADYHRVFNSCPGADPQPLLNYLKKHLQDSGHWELALVAEITHVMRLRKYRPEGERRLVDEILCRLLGEIQTTI